MKDLTHEFENFFYPKSALVFYQNDKRGVETYVEYFDMDKDGNPINAHPLTVREADRLAKALKTQTEQKEHFLRTSGILDTNVLYLDAQKGKAMWFTKAQRRELFFTQKLGIPNGTASIPPMLWVADRQSLSVFALGRNRRPTKDTKLYYAPFFNIYASGDVCMGTVDIQVKQTNCLEAFIHAWETYFFGSYFSHLMEKHNPIEGNCVLLWESLVNTNKDFPMEVLKPSNNSLKNLIK